MPDRRLGELERVREKRRERARDSWLAGRSFLSGEDSDAQNFQRLRMKSRRIKVSHSLIFFSNSSGEYLLSR